MMDVRHLAPLPQVAGQKTRSSRHPTFLLPANLQSGARCHHRSHASARPDDLYEATGDAPHLRRLQGHLLRHLEALTVALGEAVTADDVAGTVLAVRKVEQQLARVPPESTVKPKPVPRAAGPCVRARGRARAKPVPAEGPTRRQLYIAGEPAGTMPRPASTWTALHARPLISGGGPALVPTPASTSASFNGSAADQRRRAALTVARTR